MNAVILAGGPGTQISEESQRVLNGYEPFNYPFTALLPRRPMYLRLTSVRQG